MDDLSVLASVSEANLIKTAINFVYIHVSCPKIVFQNYFIFLNTSSFTSMKKSQNFPFETPVLAFQVSIHGLSIFDNEKRKIDKWFFNYLLGLPGVKDNFHTKKCHMKSVENF